MGQRVSPSELLRPVRTRVLSIQEHLNSLTDALDRLSTESSSLTFDNLISSFTKRPPYVSNLTSHITRHLSACTQSSEKIERQILGIFKTVRQHEAQYRRSIATISSAESDRLSDADFDSLKRQLRELEGQLKRDGLSLSEYLSAKKVEVDAFVGKRKEFVQKVDEWKLKVSASGDGWEDLEREVIELQSELGSFRLSSSSSSSSSKNSETLLNLGSIRRKEEGGVEGERGESSVLVSECRVCIERLEAMKEIVQDRQKGLSAMENWIKTTSSELETLLPQCREVVADVREEEEEGEGSAPTRVVGEFFEEYVSVLEAWKDLLEDLKIQIQIVRDLGAALSSSVVIDDIVEKFGGAENAGKQAKLRDEDEDAPKKPVSLVFGPHGFRYHYRRLRRLNPPEILSRVDELLIALHRQFVENPKLTARTILDPIHEFWKDICLNSLYPLEESKLGPIRKRVTLSLGRKTLSVPQQRGGRGVQRSKQYKEMSEFAQRILECWMTILDYAREAFASSVLKSDLSVVEKEDMVDLIDVSSVLPFQPVVRLFGTFSEEEEEAAGEGVDGIFVGHVSLNRQLFRGVEVRKGEESIQSGFCTSSGVWLLPLLKYDRFSKIRKLKHHVLSSALLDGNRRVLFCASQDEEGSPPALSASQYNARPPQSRYFTVVGCVQIRNSQGGGGSLLRLDRVSKSHFDEERYALAYVVEMNDPNLHDCLVRVLPTRWNWEDESSMSADRQVLFDSIVDKFVGSDADWADVVRFRDECVNPTDFWLGEGRREEREGIFLSHFRAVVRAYVEKNGDAGVEMIAFSKGEEEEDIV